MIGAHDIGGFHYPVPIETSDDTVFHSDWEARTFAMLIAASPTGTWSLDEFRHVIERMPPAEYFGSMYYVHWLEALEHLAVNEGWFSADELDARKAAIRDGLPIPDAPAPDPDKASAEREASRAIAYVGFGVRRPDLPQTFSVGDRVRATAKPIPGHTRLPRYVWGKTGTVVAYSGTFPLPESIAHRQGDNEEPVYAVLFDGTEIWGDQAEPGTSVTLDMWTSYIDLVPGTSSTLDSFDEGLHHVR